MYPSLWQILIVLVIFIFLFGHKRIRELGKSLGEALRDFRKGLEGSSDKLDKTNTDDHSTTSPVKTDLDPNRQPSQHPIEPKE